MNTVLDISCGVFWCLAYIAAIAVGFRNHSYCIPALSICMNFSWELLAVINRLQSDSPFSIAFWIQAIWCLLDLGIILTWQLFRAGKRCSRVKNFSLFAGVFLMVYIWAYMGNGWKSSVFLINLVMSVEFIVRVHTDASNWTSRFIAVAKLLGTLSATLLNGLQHRDPIVLWLGGLCFFADIYYLILLLRKRKGKAYEVSCI